MAWRLALASFALAALTGAFMRFGLYLGFPGGLRFVDVRHAHSHLMFFSWVTPVLVLCAGAALKRAGGRLPGGAWLAIAAAVAGLVAYVPFLLSGYDSMLLGGVELPVSMMASGLNGAVWYAFAAAYAWGSRGLERTPSIRLMDGAVTMLVVSTVGVLLLMVQGMTGTATGTSVAANAEYYTNLFADGWFGLGLIAAIWLAFLPQSGVANGTSSRAIGLATWALVVGLTARSGARLLADLGIASSLRMVEGLGGFLAAAAWLWLVFWSLRSGPRATRSGKTGERVASLALLLVGLKAVVELALALPAGEAFVASAGLRVLLLHAFLLGAVTLGLVSVGRELLGKLAFRGLGVLTIAVALMVGLLVPLTGLWPAALGGPWTLRAAAISSLGPPLLGAYALVVSLWPSGYGSISRSEVRHRSGQPG